MASVGEEHYTKSGVSKAIRGVLWIVIGTIALILGIILLAKNVAHTTADQNAAALSDSAVAARIKPAGTAVVDPNQPAAPASDTPAPSPDASAPAAGDTATAPPAPSGDAAAAAATTVAAAATAAAPAAAAVDGKATYEQACAMCHGAGIAGAPKIGDKAVWGPRIATGNDALYNSALKGKNAMPAKGGNAALSDDAVKAAVDHMVAQAK